MDIKIFWTMTLREIREALRNKWLILFAAGFTLLSLTLSRASLVSAGYAGLGGFGRTAASMVNGLLLFVPLIGLMIGAASISGDLERGTLVYLLSQPVKRSEIFFAKAVGNGLAIMAALFAGFGVTAMLLSTNSTGNFASYLGLITFSILLATVSLGMGLLISALTRKSGVAIGIALIVWLGLVFLGDLGMISASLALRPTPGMLFGILLINPLQSFKVGAIYSLRSNLDALGVVGHYAAFRYGDTLPFILTGILIVWSAVCMGIALMIFQKKADI